MKICLKNWFLPQEPCPSHGKLGKSSSVPCLFSKMIKPEVLALEAADASAIEEVNLAYENVKEVDGLDITKEGAEAW